MLKLNLFIFCFFCFVYVESYQGPTAQLLKRAYCACECCKQDGQTCYKHPVLENEVIDCNKYNCTEDFCDVLRMEECRAGCFCRKCKDKLPESEKPRCLLRQDGEVASGCDCQIFNDDEMDCDVIRRPHNAPTQEQMGLDDVTTAEMTEELNRYRSQAKCVIPCFCLKCRDTQPPEMTSQCNDVQPPGEHCLCESTKCPTKQDYEKYETLKVSVQEAKYRAIMSAGDDDQLAAEQFNKEMSQQISSGKLAPMTSQGIHDSKCQLQCICDKCKEEGREVQEGQCRKFIPNFVSGCLKCPEGVQCLGREAATENCAIVCVCQKCDNHKEMTPSLRESCGRLLKELTSPTSSSTCECEHEKVDCNVLAKLRKMIGNQSGGSDVTTTTSGEKKPTKGKFKQKYKHWDEL